MSTDILNIGLAFVEGFGLIISPCILPILPIILAGSLESSKKRPIGIVVGFVFMFALFTFFSRKLVQYSGIDLTLIRHISYVLLALFGVVMLSSVLTEKFARLTQKLGNTGSSLSANNPQGGFFSGIIFGALVGLIWTPCAGPILAAVIVQTVIQTTSLSSFFVILAFGIGAAIPMLIIALFGRKMMNRFSFFKKHTELFRKVLGVIIIASVGYMIYSEGATVSFAGSENASTQSQSAQLIGGLGSPYAAPDIAGITAWINSQPLTMQQLKGKVVLIDFWTYSCINCIRTLPYIKTWYQKYHDKGFEIIGVHSPEFDFEKNESNVRNAVKNDGILYPVALDNNFVTWRNFNNSYWPAHYLIDKNGQVVYQHFGEGDYDVTENNIRFLLGLKGPATTETGNEENINEAQTPETYLGYARMSNYASPEKISAGKSATYTFPDRVAENQWALSGDWKVNADRIVSTSANASLKMHFNARKVYMVMGSSAGFSIRVKVMLNGEGVQSEKGGDVTNSTMTVTSNRLYEVISLPAASNGVLQITASAPGLEVYTFTFG